MKSVLSMVHKSNPPSPPVLLSNPSLRYLLKPWGPRSAASRRTGPVLKQNQNEATFGVTERHSLGNSIPRTVAMTRRGPPG